MPGTRFDWNDFLFSFEGRVSLRDYWLRLWLPFAIYWIGFHLLAATIIVWAEFMTAGTATPFDIEHSDAGGFALDVISFFEILPLLPIAAISVKRCHDIGRSGHWLLMLLIPIAGIVWWLGRLGLTAGNPGANRFGRDPLEPKLSAGPSGTTVAG